MAVPLSVLRGRVRTDSTDVAIELPVLVTPEGVLLPLLDFCVDHVNQRSLKWMRKVVRAVALFLEYCWSNSSQPVDYRLFLNFSTRLSTGTFDKTGVDPSGLGWAPVSRKEANSIVRRLTDFFERLARTIPEAAALNPLHAGSKYDRMIVESAYQHKREKAFLGNTWASSFVNGGEDSVHLVRAARPAREEPSQPPAFPEEHFLRLLLEGFRVGRRYDFRCMLITLLLHGAGFRESEPFHMFISDVVPSPINPKSALVFLHHPTEGGAPDDWQDSRGRRKRGNRGAYLREVWGLPPRNEVMGAAEAGWKGGAHEKVSNAKFFRAYWFIPEYGELFLALWYCYLRQIVDIERSHPFAFVNTWREPLGSEYKLGQFNKAHAAAVERIGLNVSKADGTTPHGHRHRYGRLAAKAGIDPEIRRRMFHHLSPESQGVYTTPTELEIFQELTKAKDTLDNGVALAAEIREATTFFSMD